jgi:hypothetical protein
MLSVVNKPIMLSVIMLNVVAPYFTNVPIKIVFVLGKPFNSNLMFVGKATFQVLHSWVSFLSYPSEAPFRFSTKG